MATHGWCTGSSRDLFYAGLATISDATTDPRLQVRLYKCDGTAMSEDKSCHIRVGSYSGSYSNCSSGYPSIFHCFRKSC